MCTPRWWLSAAGAPDKSHLMWAVWGDNYQEGQRWGLLQSDGPKGILLIAAASSAIKWWKLPHPFQLHWSLRCSSVSLTRAPARAFLLPRILPLPRKEKLLLNKAGSLLLTKTLRMYFFNPKVTGAYNLSCDTGTTERSSFTLRSELPVCSWPQWTDPKTMQNEFWGNKCNQVGALC